MIEWWKSGVPKNCMIVQNRSGADGGYTGTGQLLLKDFDQKGDRGDYQDADLAFVPAGVFEWEQND
jgi:hypothetical protein